MHVVSPRLKRTVVTVSFRIFVHDAPPSNVLYNPSVVAAINERLLSGLMIRSPTAFPVPGENVRPVGFQVKPASIDLYIPIVLRGISILKVPVARYSVLELEGSMTRQVVFCVGRSSVMGVYVAPLSFVTQTPL